MAKWKCKLCGYIYDEEKGDLSRNVPAGTLLKILHYPINALNVVLEKLCLNL